MYKRRRISFSRFAVSVFVFFSVWTMLRTSKATAPEALWRPSIADIPRSATPVQRAAILRTFSHNPDERRRGATILGNTAKGSPEVIPYLIRLLDDSEEVRSQYKDAYDELLDRQATPSQAAQDALLWIGRGAVKPLSTVLESKDVPPSIRCAATRLLGSLRDPDSLGTLRAIVGSADERLRESGMYALGGFHSAESAAILLRALRNPKLSASSRRVAIVALGENGHSSAAQDLVAITADHSNSVDLRLASICALGQIGDPAGYPMLLESVDSRDDEICAAAAHALSAFPSQTVSERLLAIILDKKRDFLARRAAIFGLTGSRDPAVASRLLRIVGDEDIVDSRLREQAIIALARSDNPVLLKAFFSHLEDGRTRRAAEDALPAVHSGKAISMVAETLRNPKWLDDDMLQLNGYFALSRIRSPDAADSLVAIASDSRLAVKSRVLALDALGRVRDDCVVPRIEKLASDTSAPIRSQVAKVLGMIGSMKASQTLKVLAQDSDKRVRLAAEYSLASLGEECPGPSELHNRKEGRKGDGRAY